MKKILLTGGKGFFASRFAGYYRDRYQIWAPGHREMDVTDASQVADSVKGFAPDIIIHTGAIAVTQYCNEHPDVAHKINVEGSVNVARAAADAGSRMVFLSSEQVFNGSTAGGPFREEDAPVPDTVYGENKAEAERLLRSITDRLWIVRFTWMFDLPAAGCGMAGNILMDTISKLVRRETISASKREFRGMGYMQETVRNFETLFDCPYGTWHMGAENPCSRYEIVAHILKLLGLGQSAGDPMEQYLKEDEIHYLDHNRDVRLDVSKAAATGMHWTPTRDALEKCLKEYSVIRS